MFTVMENTEQQLLQLEKIAPLVPSTICSRTIKKEGAIKHFETYDLPTELSGISPVQVFHLSEADPGAQQTELEILTDSSDSAETPAHHARGRLPTPTQMALNALPSPLGQSAVPQPKKDDDEAFVEAVSEV